MANKYPIENLLREPVEYWPGITYFAIALLIYIIPNALLLTSRVGHVLGLILILLGLKRISQGWKITSYKRNLKKLPLYKLATGKIQISNEKLFIGKGFKWKALHTQRLYDCQKIGNEKYTETKHKKISDAGGNPILHGVGFSEEENAYIALTTRTGHLLVLGTTRVGKTRLLEILAAQDIRRGDTVIIFDPKGDADLLRRIYAEAKACGREDDVIIFHLGFPKISARYNAIGNFARVTEVANRVANQLPSKGESQAFKEFVWRFVNIITKALAAMGRRPDYKQIQKYILNMDKLFVEYCKHWLLKIDKNWEQEVEKISQSIDYDKLPSHMKVRSQQAVAIAQYVEKHNYFDEIAQNLYSAFNYDKTYFDKITASLLPLIEKLTSGKTAELISPNYFDINDKRPIFDWMQVIKGKKIVYVGLDALSDKTVAEAVGNSMFADLCSISGRIYKYGVDGNSLSGNKKEKKEIHPVYIHSDEFNELIGDEFIPLLNKAGGAGFRVSVYTQTWSDVEAKLGNRAKAQQVSGNLNSIITMRVLDEDTAHMITNKLPQKVQVHDIQQISSATDSKNGDFSSSNEDRIMTREVSMLSPNDLLQLPKGQAFALLEGGQLWKLRLPLAEEVSEEIPEHVEAMASYMQKQQKQQNESKGIENDG